MSPPSVTREDFVFPRARFLMFPYINAEPGGTRTDMKDGENPRSAKAVLIFNQAGESNQKSTVYIRHCIVGRPLCQEQVHSALHCLRITNARKVRRFPASIAQGASVWAPP